MEWLGFLILGVVAVAGFVWMGQAGGYGEAAKVILFSVTVTAIIVIGTCLATTGMWLWEPGVWDN